MKTSAILFVVLVVVLEVAYLCRERLIDKLIEYARRTPYYDLPGYMNRLWLVPYNYVVERKVWHASHYTITTDGTGPVPWSRPFVRLVQKLGIAMRVHEILRSDYGRHPHNHPWPYVSIILRGGYYEMRYDENGNFKSYKYHGAGSIIFRRANSWHRLELLPAAEGSMSTSLCKPVVTLFITGRKAQEWGFNVAGVVVPHDEYKGK